MAEASFDQARQAFVKFIAGAQATAGSIEERSATVRAGAAQPFRAGGAATQSSQWLTMISLPSVISIARPCPRAKQFPIRPRETPWDCRRERFARQ